MIDTMGAYDTFLQIWFFIYIIESKSLVKITDDRVNASLDYVVKVATQIIRQNGSFRHGIMIR